jgi:four helix bundle protein
MQGFRDLEVYQLASRLAMEIYHESKSLPKDERFSLTDQIRRSSRSVAANIGERFRKRQYPKMFLSKLADANAEATETQVWLDAARDCDYMTVKRRAELTKGDEEVGKLLGTRMSMPEKYCAIHQKVGKYGSPISPFRFPPSETCSPFYRRYP